MMLVFKTLSKKVVLFILAIIFALSAQQVRGQSSSDYIQKHAPMAVEMMKKTGIPASVILGVGMVESGNGASKNCRLLKNHFGIVGTNRLKGSYHSRYKQYETEKDSYNHFTQILSAKSWFKDLQWNFDPHTWLKHINANNNYSTAGDQWNKRIENTINTNGLRKYDKM